MLKISEKLLIIADIVNPLGINKLLSKQLLNATKSKCAVSIEYISITDGTSNHYTIMPLEIKVRKLKNGSQLVLYAEDIDSNNRTKSFIVKNIRNIKTVKNIKNRIRENLLEKYI